MNALAELGDTVATVFAAGGVVAAVFFSLSCLQTLKNPRPTDPTILRVLIEVHFLQTQQSKKVVFAWCPDVGITGNERDDSATKSAAKGPRSEQACPAQDLAMAARRNVTKAFHEWWV